MTPPDVKVAGRVLVCGGRDYSDAAFVKAILDEVRPATVIDGGARGADTLAFKWAFQNSVSSVRFHADWERHGKAAGAIRNRQMLDHGKPDLVIAFPGGRGTDDMVRQANKAGVPVRDLREVPA